MHRVDDDLYTLDLGAHERTIRVVEDELPATPLADEERAALGPLEGGALHLAQAQTYKRRLEEGAFKNRAAIARELGVTRARLTQIMSLLNLDVGLQRDVIAGRFGYVTDKALRAIALTRRHDEQLRALEEYRRTKSRLKRDRSSRVWRRRMVGKTERLRLVVYFNPQMFVEQRTTAERHRREIEEQIDDLNARLRRSTVPRAREAVYADVVAILTTFSLVSAYPDLTTGL
jgi:hypothetical protein